MLGIMASESDLKLHFGDKVKAKGHDDVDSTAHFIEELESQEEVARAREDD
jgi:hypothetical protein